MMNPLKKKKLNPEIRKADILPQVIFSALTPLIPKHDMASNPKLTNFVQIGFENNPVYFWKFSRILSMIATVAFASTKNS